MKYHYVYYSYEEWGRGYIGVRTCKCLPENDKRYFGSFTDKTFNPKYKIILGVFSTREEALGAEINLHDFYQIDVNPHFANRSKQKTSKFTFYWTEERKLNASKRALLLKIKPKKMYGKDNGQYKLRKWFHEEHGIRICSISDLIKEFKDDRLLDSTLSKVVLGKRKSHKGWRNLAPN